MITMIKDIMNANDSATPNSREMAVLKENFPSCFKTDGSFDIERFKEFLSDKIAVTGEGYELKFLGKNYARLLTSIDTTTVVVPDEEHNSKPENMNSENIYISGDNLDGLKHLLKSYSNQVKCIYIDPPYNTGTDGFVYNDQFNFTVEELSEKLSISEEQAQRILDLTKRGSASHSAWLMFMYPRLQLARDLLSKDGVIFISIGNDEMSNLRIICDDIFGEENFIGNISRVMKSGGGKGQFFSPNIDYILTYARNITVTPKFRVPVSQKTLNNYYKNVESEGERKGERYGEERIFVSGLDVRPNQRYWIACPDGSFVIPEGSTFPNKIAEGEQVTPVEGDGCWKWTYDTYKREKEKGNIVFKVTTTSPLIDENGNRAKYNLYNKVWLSEKEGSVPGDIITQFENRLSSAEMKKLNIPFDFAKPSALISYLLELCQRKSEESYYMLDFFSGSGTTADSIMRLNAEDNGKRRFILIQLPEKVKEGSEAEKVGFNTIDQIGIERIIRAAKKIKEEFPDTTSDLGFKHYTLVEPEQNTLDKLEKFDPTENKLFADKDILSKFGKYTVLATWLVRDGYGLTADAEELNFAGYNGYYIGKHLYLIDPELSNKAIEAIVVKYETDGSFNPENVVLFGYSFTWTEMEALKINLKRLKDTEKNLRINFDIRY